MPWQQSRRRRDRNRGARALQACPRRTSEIFSGRCASDNIRGRLLHVLLIAVPLLVQVYLNSSLAYGLMRLLKVPYFVAAPGALIGASNFLELAVCSICNRTRHWFPSTASAWQGGRREAAGPTPGLS